MLFCHMKHRLLYKSIGKSVFSGNLQPFQDFLTNLTGISVYTHGIDKIYGNVIEMKVFKDKFVKPHSSFEEGYFN